MYAHNVSVYGTGCQAVCTLYIYTGISLQLVSLAQPDSLPNAMLRRGSGDIAINDFFSSPTFW